MLWLRVSCIEKLRSSTGNGWEKRVQNRHADVAHHELMGKAVASLDLRAIGDELNLPALSPARLWIPHRLPRLPAQTHLMILAVCGGSPGGKDELEPGNGATQAGAARAHDTKASEGERRESGAGSAQKNSSTAADAAIQVLSPCLPGLARQRRVL